MRTVRSVSRLPGWGAFREGGVLSGGVCASWGDCRGVYLVWGVPAQVLPPCGQTDTYKNITFATLLRTVITEWFSFHAHHGFGDSTNCDMTTEIELFIHHIQVFLQTTQKCQYWRFLSLLHENKKIQSKKSQWE